jgi:tRNA G18 (ribose-2'-O)-methylase SpoU
MKGYFGIGIYHPQKSVNIGTLWRTANILGASFIFTIGRKYKKQSSDTMKTPNHVPLFYYENFDGFKKCLPDNCDLIAIEIINNAKMLKNFCHPKCACYLLGAESYGIPADILNKCDDTIQLGGEYCMNVSVAGSIVLYHRTVLN